MDDTYPKVPKPKILFAVMTGDDKVATVELM